MTNPSDSIYKIIAELGDGEVCFPTHADVAFRVRLALDDPDIHLVKAAQIVQAEPLLAARVVALANSVAFNRAAAPVADVRSAVARLGLKFVRALATAVVMRQMAAGVQSPAARALAVRLWEHTAHVAALAHVLARHFSRQVPDAALFAGIVHEVGGFYLIAQMDAHPGLLADGGVLPADAGVAVGEAVMRALAVPADVLTAVEFLWHPTSAAFPPATLGDLLVLANRLTPIASPLEAPEPESLPPVENSAAEALLAEILEESAEEMDALTSALRY